MREAECFLSEPVRTVLDKKGIAPSGEKRDYYSVGRYYWPPGEEAAPLPWVHRDGEISPEALAAGDFPAWSTMGRLIAALGLTWHFSGEQRYAARAVEWLMAWFETPETRMNPHFRFSAAAPGRHDGGGIGLIEAAEPLAFCLNGIPLLRRSPAWQPSLDRALGEWLEAFYGWMLTDPGARRAFEHPNNIGVWTEALAALLGLHLGREAEVRQRLERLVPSRIAQHIEPDGSQPSELRRTLSFHYSCYLLEALLRCAELAGRVGLDFWTYTTPDGRSLRKALLFLGNNQPWPFPNIREPDLGKLEELFSCYLGRVGSDPELEAVAERFRDRDPQGWWRLTGSAFYV